MKRRTLLLLTAASLSPALPPALRLERSAQAAPHQEPKPESLASFPNGPSPAGNITLDDVRLEPKIAEPFSHTLGTGVLVRYENGTLSLAAERKPETLWQGPVSKVPQFTMETVAAIHTLKDSSGQTLWSDAEETPTPDLALMKNPDGSAKLLDKQGAVLWSGQITPTDPHNRSSQVKGSDITTANVHIGKNANTGVFTVTDTSTRQVLWSGRLPERPTLLVREGSQFTFTSPHRGHGGSDNTVRTTFEGQSGTVTVSNLQGKVLGTLPLEYLTIHKVTDTSGMIRPFEHPVNYLLPAVSLKTDGTALLAFKDSAGKVFRHTRVYRDGGHSGSLSGG